MKNQKTLAVLIETFFTEHLAVHRGVSQNTIQSYRDAIKLFLLFVGEKNSKKITDININDLNVDIVLGFLKNIEGSRKNGAVTRNHRLAALRTFFSYLATQDPLHLGQYQKILLVPFKRAAKPMMGYLEADEMKAVLNSIDCTTPLGRRDFALLSLLYNTGARVQEVCDLRVRSLRLLSPPLITIYGKGKKTRQVPLWTSTKDTLTKYLSEGGLLNKEDAFLFPNRAGEPIGRFGVRYIVAKYVQVAAKSCPKIAKKKVGPHTFRHTTAMHLLQSGVDLTVIRSWLGHIDISTTHGYVEIDMEMKRQALEKCNPGNRNGSLDKFIEKNHDIIGWLENL